MKKHAYGIAIMILFCPRLLSLTFYVYLQYSFYEYLQNSRLLGFHLSASHPIAVAPVP